MASAEYVLKIAGLEVGYKEKASNKDLDSKTANSGHNNYTKYARDLDNVGWFNGNKQGYDWCAVFVSWCFFKSELNHVSNAKKMCYQPMQGNCAAGCGYALKYYKNNNAYYVNAKVGDQIFFCWAGNNSSTDHTGIVEKVDNTYVYTIEGNASDGVIRRKYKKNDKCIVGYGRPNYTENIVTKSTVVKSETVAKETKTEDLGFNVKVTPTNGLNVRTGAGTSFPRITALPCGTVVKVQQESKGWGYITYGSLNGWICLAYTIKC